MEVLQPLRQKAWGWPAAVNFILGAMGSGFYLLSLLAMLLWGEAFGLNEPAAFKVIGPLLAALGLSVLVFEAGRPLRSGYLLSHLKQSWMSRETLAGLLFVLCALLDLLFPNGMIRLLAAAGAAGFLVSQALLVYCARSVIAWNVPLLPLLFVSSGLATGGGVLLLNSAGVFGADAAVLVLCLIGWDLAVWLLYLFRSPQGAFHRATKALRRARSLLLTVGIGHILPILLLLPAAMMPEHPIGAGSPSHPIVLAGLCVMAGGAAMKAGIILQAGYLRGIELGHRETMPDRQGPAEEEGEDK